MPPRDRSRERAIAVAFGIKVREARLAAGLTQEQVAEAADLHPTFISNLERGYRVPTIVTVLKLAAALDAPAGDLLSGLEELLTE